MSRTSDIRAAGLPVLDFDTNGDLPVHGHWSEIDRLQEEHPWFWTTYGYGFWVLTDPAAIREAFANPELFSSTAEVASEPNPSYTFIPTNVDPPEHVKYRHILNPWFSPGAVTRLGPRLETTCRAIVDRFRDRGRCELVSEFAEVFPTEVFMVSLGLPVDDTDLFVRLVRRIFANLRDPARAPALREALAEVRDYFTEALSARARRAADAGHDFLDYLRVARKDGVPLAEEEILNICQVLVMAGLETSAGQLSFMFHHLATHPDDQERLRRHPELGASAVEEFLRLHSIVLPGRKVTSDVDFHGCPMHKGDMVMLTIPAANRCPAEFRDSHQVDLARRPNRHIAFGAGPHRCLGIHLARRELATALAVWHEAIGPYRVDGAGELTEHGGQLRLAELPLVWGSAAD